MPTVDVVATAPTTGGNVRSDDSANNWPNARAGATLGLAPGEEVRLLTSSTKFTFSLARVEEAFAEFDTADASTGIPTDATIVRAVITLTSFRDDGGGGRIIEAAIRDYGGGDVTTADFVAGADLEALAQVAEFTIAVPRPLGTVEVFTSTDLVANINRAGMTRMVFYDKGVRTNTAPAVADAETIFCSAKHATSAYRPKLTLTWSRRFEEDFFQPVILPDDRTVTVFA